MTIEDLQLLPRGDLRRVAESALRSGPHVNRLRLWHQGNARRLHRVYRHEVSMKL